MSKLPEKSSENYLSLDNITGDMNLSKVFHQISENFNKYRMEVVYLTYESRPNILLKHISGDGFCYPKIMVCIVSYQIRGQKPTRQYVNLT